MTTDDCDVHLFRNSTHGGWKAMQGKRILANHSSWERAMVLAMRRAERDRVDLILHGREGKIPVEGGLPAGAGR